MGTTRERRVEGGICLLYGRGLRPGYGESPEASCDRLASGSRCVTMVATPLEEEFGRDGVLATFSGVGAFNRVFGRHRSSGLWFFAGARLPRRV